MKITANPFILLKWLRIPIVLGGGFLFMIYVLFPTRLAKMHAVTTPQSSVISHLYMVQSAILYALRSDGDPLPRSFAEVASMVDEYWREAPSGIDSLRLLEDPFSGGRLRFRRTDQAMIIYSVGPDGIDQNGEIEYRRKNGLRSQGDISLWIYPKDEAAGVIRTKLRGYEREFELSYKEANDASSDLMEP